LVSLSFGLLPLQIGLLPLQIGLLVAYLWLTCIADNFDKLIYMKDFNAAFSFYWTLQMELLHLWAIQLQVSIKLY